MNPTGCSAWWAATPTSPSWWRGPSRTPGWGWIVPTSTSAGCFWGRGGGRRFISRTRSISPSVSLSTRKATRARASRSSPSRPPAASWAPAPPSPWSSSSAPSRRSPSTATWSATSSARRPRSSLTSRARGTRSTPCCRSRTRPPAASPAPSMRVWRRRWTSGPCRRRRSGRSCSSCRMPGSSTLTTCGRSSRIGGRCSRGAGWGRRRRT
mmetsp:Transcript_50152/g.132212  ORF Transcript_50152/g.132212 Transcript_50152/m.132212 type:complete len:210 (-) Transcript_50152:56-685(-)